ncbi:MAG: response regulator [Armatimonadota bacterium]
MHVHDQNAHALLGQILLTSSVINEQQLSEALRRQQSTGELFTEVLLAMRAVTPEQLERALRCQARLRGRPEARHPFILVVDDDPEVGAVVGEILEGAGYRVGIAQNAAEALAALLAPDPPPPAALVLDLGLPQTSGVELLGMLREMSETRSLPVVILTGRPDLEPQLRGRGLAISAFLAKPTSARQLLGTVESAIRESALSGAAAGG